jgi:hypothetical protein
MKSRICHYKKNNRKTKRKNGGDFFQNVFGNLLKDKNVKKNYYETEIVVTGITNKKNVSKKVYKKNVSKKVYKINYFIPSNTILFKTTESLWTPTFNVIVDKTNQPKDYYIMINDLYVNYIIIIEKKWYVITRLLDHLKKGDLPSSTFYRILNVFENKEDTLFIKNPVIKDNIITISKRNFLKIDGKKYPHKFNILAQFDMQQETGSLGKEVATDVVAVEAFDKVDEFL